MTDQPTSPVSRSNDLARAMVPLLQRLGPLAGDAGHPLGEAVRAIWSPDECGTGDQTDRQAALLLGVALFVAHCRLGGLSQLLEGRHPGADTRGSPRLKLFLEGVRRGLEQPGDHVAPLRQLVAQVGNATAERGGATWMPRDPDGDQRPGLELLYFLEQLLASSDSTLRRKRGAYFTPWPLVQFIVRSVDATLREQFQLAGGLAAGGESLRVVDPACGSGAFLLGVVEHLRGIFRRSGSSAQWRRFRGNELRRRLIGCDVMPACCGAVRLMLEQDLELALSENVDHAGDSALSSPSDWEIHCRNPLEDVDFIESLFDGRLPVIIGNPPYANFGQQNRGAWILQQLDEYKSQLAERKLNLNDDYIKFLRWAQFWIERCGCGVLALVTNNTYLSGITQRQMRASLADTFDEIHVLDLHGNRKKRECGPSGGADENVFPIQQGVAISLCVRLRHRSVGRKAVISHAELWGTRDAKLTTLATSSMSQVSAAKFVPAAPHYFFVPSSCPDTHRRASNEYARWPSVDTIFRQYVSGVQTKRDRLFVDFTAGDVRRKMAGFLENAARGQFHDSVPSWLRRSAPGVPFDPNVIRPYMVAPFDLRWVYYEPRLLGRARFGVLRHLDPGNVALVFMRQTTNNGNYDHFLATNVLASDRIFYSAHGAPFLAPLFLGQPDRRATNLDPAYVAELEQRLEVPFDDTGNRTSTSFGSWDVFYWLYAIGYCRIYRERFGAQLRIGFPRIPWPDNRAHFQRVERLGRRLATLHVEATGPRARSHLWTARAYRPIALPAGYPRWTPDGVLALNQYQDWPEPVDADVWTFQVGGYQVIPRWLKQRTRRDLTFDDVTYLERLIRTARRTIRCMDQIDQAVMWPATPWPEWSL